MSVEATLVGPFPFGTLTQTGTNRSRQPQQAASGLNVDYIRDSDELSARRGYKLAAICDPGASGDENSGGYGLFYYAHEDLLVSVGTLVTTYSKQYLQLNATDRLMSFYFDETLNEWIARVTTLAGVDISGSPVAVGIGYEEASPFTVDELALDIPAGVVSSTPGYFAFPGGEPAATMNLVLQAYLGAAGGFRHYFRAPRDPRSLMAGYDLSRVELNNNINFEIPASATEKGRILYILGTNNTLFDRGLYKIDGRRLYKAGLPKATLTSVSDAAGAVGNGSYPNTYQHAVLFKQVDHQANIILGPISDSVETVIAAASDFTLTINQLKDDEADWRRGYNVDFVRVNGAQTFGVGVPRIVDVYSSAPFTIGESVFYINRDTDLSEEAVVSAIPSSTEVTLSTPLNNTVEFNNNDVITANARVAIYRTEANGTLLRLVQEVPFDPEAASLSYVDDIDDSQLGETYENPEIDSLEHSPLLNEFRERDLIQVMQHQDLLVVITDDSIIWSKDVDTPEAFPLAHETSIASSLRNGQSLTAGISDNLDLLLFSKRSTIRIAGTLVDGIFQKAVESAQIGCISHATLKRYNDVLIWCGADTVYISRSGFTPEDIGKPIHRFFNQNEIPENQRLVFSQAFAEIDADNERYILFVPSVDKDASSHVAGPESKTFVYDFKRQGWLPPWDSLNMAGGLVAVDNDIFFSERRYSNFLSRMVHNVYQQLNSYTKYDFIDHSEAIDAEYLPGWVHLGNPAGLKSFITLVLFGDGPDADGEIDVRVRTELNFVPAVYDTDVTLTFGPLSTDRFKQCEFRAGRSVRALRPYLSFTVENQFLVLSEWMLQLSEPFKSRVRT